MKYARLLCTLIWCSLFLLLAVTAAHGSVQLPQGRYYEDVADLSVKVLGGRVEIRRTWWNDQWLFNAAWQDLQLEYDSLSGEVKAIVRNDFRYEKSGGSTQPVYVFGKRQYILTTATGYQWRNRKGDWIDYDQDGRKTVNTYDDANRLTEQKHYASGQSTPERTLIYGYDNNSNLTSYNDGQISASYVYDKNNRKTEETTNYGSFSLTHSYTL